MRILSPEQSVLPVVRPAKGPAVTFTLCFLTAQMGARGCSVWLPGDKHQQSDWTSDKEQAEIPRLNQPLLK